MAVDAHHRKHDDPKSRMPANLRHRPAKPAYRNGKHQRLVERALHSLGVASTAQFCTWCYAESWYRTGSLRHWHYEAARRALRQMGAVPIGRGEGSARPIMWMLPRK
jgi:hypothetical protein